jgi:hypothetical protein
MSEKSGVREIAWFDCGGGGQIVVDHGYAYVGHMASPQGTSIVDVRDPKSPRCVAELRMPAGTHSHKVRVANGVMLINREVNDADSTGDVSVFRGGLGIYDVSDPAHPREITRWETTGKGVHRFDFDGRYVYCSPTVEGYVGNIVMILDLKDPARPHEVGRWWMPGQWTAGGEVPRWKGAQHRCHHPLRLGQRLYTSYWHAGFVILDIADMSNPRLVSGLDWSPPFVCPTHSAVPVPFEIGGRRLLVVADEDVDHLAPGPPAFLWIVDITDEWRPISFASFQLDHLDDTPHPPNTGCHQPIEKLTTTEIPVAWFANGLRIVEIAKPHAPREAARFVPDPPPGSKRPSSNDVFVDDRGLIYLIDRMRGLYILERP